VSFDGLANAPDQGSRVGRAAPRFAFSELCASSRHRVASDGELGVLLRRKLESVVEPSTTVALLGASPSGAVSDALRYF
jgi:hypothetical protein